MDVPEGSSASARMGRDSPFHSGEAGEQVCLSSFRSTCLGNMKDALQAGINAARTMRGWGFSGHIYLITPPDGKATRSVLRVSNQLTLIDGRYPRTAHAS